MPRIPDASLRARRARIYLQQHARFFLEKASNVPREWDRAFVRPSRISRPPHSALGCGIIPEVSLGGPVNACDAFAPLRSCEIRTLVKKREEKKFGESVSSKRGRRGRVYRAPGTRTPTATRSRWPANPRIFRLACENRPVLSLSLSLFKAQSAHYSLRNAILLRMGNFSVESPALQSARENRLAAATASHYRCSLHTQAVSLHRNRTGATVIPWPRRVELDAVCNEFIVRSYFRRSESVRET